MWECNSKKFRSDASAASPVDRLAGGMTADEHWDVQRYVLEDPTLDRSAFEVRLLADPRLAEAVAACVRQVQLIAVAGPESPASAGSYASASHLRRRWLGSGGVPSAIAPGLVGLASVVLLALGWIAWRSGGGHAPREAGAMGGEMSAVAESWLAMIEVPPGGEGVDLGTIQLVEATPEGAVDLSTEAAANESGWILEAGAEFFRQADS